MAGGGRVAVLQSHSAAVASPPPRRPIPAALRFFQCTASVRRRSGGFFASAAAASPNKQIMDRVLLRHLKQESKCMSRREKITSIDSDTSAPRVTEHKTSASELNSLLLQADVLASKIKTDDSADNSDAFLTATSDQLKTVEWTSTRRWSGSGWRGNKSRGYFGLHLGLQRRS